MIGAQQAVAIFVQQFVQEAGLGQLAAGAQHGGQLRPAGPGIMVLVAQQPLAQRQAFFETGDGLGVTFLVAVHAAELMQIAGQRQGHRTVAGGILGRAPGGNGGRQTHFAQRLPGEPALFQPFQQRVQGARQGKPVVVAAWGQRHVLAAGNGVGLVQLDFIEITVERQGGQTVAFPQQRFEHALVAGQIAVRVAAAPQRAPFAVGAVD